MRFRMTDFRCGIWNMDFPRSKHLCQPVNRVNSWWIVVHFLFFVGEKLRTFTCLLYICSEFVIFNKLAKFFCYRYNIWPPHSLSLSSSAVNNVSRNVCKFFENPCRKFTFHWNLTKRWENRQLKSLCLSFLLSVFVSAWNNSSAAGSVFMKFF